MRFLRAHFIQLYVAALLATLMIGCVQKEPILIGFSGGLTGRHASLGVDGRDGALLAVKLVNQRGGINGRLLEMLIEDDGGVPDQALAADQALIDAGVIVIIGHMTSEMSMAVRSLFNLPDVIYISPTTATPDLVDISDQFIRLIPVNSFTAGAIGEYSITELGVQRAAVLYDLDNQAFTETYADYFENSFEAMGGELVFRQGYVSSEEPDFRPILEQVAAASPEAVLVVASAIDSALIAQQADLVGLEAQFLFSNWSLTSDLLAYGGEAVEGVFAIATHDENNPAPGYQAFQETFVAEYGREPTFASGYGYEAVLVLAAALEKTGGSTDGLLDALLAIKDFPGVHGRITFTPYGDVVRTLFLISVQDGEFYTADVWETQLEP